MGQRDNVLKYAKSQIGVCEPSGDDVYLKWYNKLVGSSLPMNASWCFGAGTVIDTPSGSKYIEDIRPGDIVYSGDYKECVVERVASHIADNVRKFRVVGAIPLTVTGDHKIWAKKRIKYNGNRVPGHAIYTEPDWFQVDDLQRGDLVAMPKPTDSGHRDIDLWDAYFIGRWLGDGYATNTQYCICCAFDECDELESIMDVIGLSYKKQACSKKTCQQYAFYKYAEQNSIVLDILSRCGRGALEKHFPPDVFQWSIECQKMFIHGLIDSDGHYSARYNRVSIGSVSKKMITDYVKLIRRFDVLASIVQAHSEGESYIQARKVYIHDSWSADVVWSMFAESWKNYKQIYKVDDDVIWSPVKEIADIEQTMVYNMSVAGEHTYIANGIKVHNCVCFVTWCLRNAGVPTSVFGNCAQCSIALSWAKSKKIWYSRLTGHHPKVGELILFDWDGDKKPDHIGIVTQSGTNSLKTIEGNTKGSFTVDGVREKQYSSTSKYIYGYIDLQYSDELDGTDVARVSAVQLYLKDVCKLQISVDGKWGPKSKSAMVKAVQTVLNDDCGSSLVIDGVWGTQTSAAFREYKSGCKGKMIYLIQGCLIANGQSLDMDGSFGPLTKTAVKAFQTKNSLSVDGIVGRKTMRQLVR